MEYVLLVNELQLVHYCIIHVGNSTGPELFTEVLELLRCFELLLQDGFLLFDVPLQLLDVTT